VAGRDGGLLYPAPAEGGEGGPAAAGRSEPPGTAPRRRGPSRREAHGPREDGGHRGTPHPGGRAALREMTGRAGHTRGVVVPGVRPAGHLGGRLSGRGGHGRGPARRDRRRDRRRVMALGTVGTREHHGQQPGHQEQEDGGSVPV